LNFNKIPLIYLVNYLALRGSAMNKIFLKSLVIFFLFIFTLPIAMGCRTNIQDLSGSKTVETVKETVAQENQQSNESIGQTRESETTTAVSSDTTKSTEMSLDKSKYLTVADVEKVSGQTGLKLIDYDPSIVAGGDLNFAKSDNTMFLLAQIQNKSTVWDAWKKQEGFFNEAIPGVGDEAYNGPKGMGVIYVLFFYKGNTAFSLSSFFNLTGDGKPYFSQDQLIELAKIMLSR
jgi:hypothetical protein